VIQKYQPNDPILSLLEFTSQQFLGVEQLTDRLIHHFSYPDAQSINDFIPEDAKRVMYASVDDAVKLIFWK
jgi:hypothetical protein